MGLTIKDAVTTFLAFIVSVLGFFHLKGQMLLPLLSSYRLSSLLLIVIGIAMCAIGADPKSSGTSNPIVKWLFGGLGVIALVAALVGVIFGNKYAFFLLAGIILLMWMMATLKHLFNY